MLLNYINFRSRSLLCVIFYGIEKHILFFSGYVNGRNVESKPRQSGWCKSPSHSNPVGCSTTNTTETSLKEDIAVK